MRCKDVAAALQRPLDSPLTSEQSPIIYNAVKMSYIQFEPYIVVQDLASTDLVSFFFFFIWGIYFDR